MQTMYPKTQTASPLANLAAIALEQEHTFTFEGPPETPEIKQIEAETLAKGKIDEKPLLRHFSEKRLKAIYFAIYKRAFHDMTGDAGKSEVCNNLHITADQYDAIETVGDERNWPQPGDN